MPITVILLLMTMAVIMMADDVGDDGGIRPALQTAAPNANGIVDRVFLFWVAFLLRLLASSYTLRCSGLVASSNQSKRNLRVSSGMSILRLSDGLYKASTAKATDARKSLTGVFPVLSLLVRLLASSYAIL